MGIYVRVNMIIWKSYERKSRGGNINISKFVRFPFCERMTIFIVCKYKWV